MAEIQIENFDKVIENESLEVIRNYFKKRNQKEIKDIMSYLAVINITADNLRLKRIINEPKRKIGDKTVADIEYLA